MLQFPTRPVVSRLSFFCLRCLSGGDTRIKGEPMLLLPNHVLMQIRIAGDRAVLQLKGRDPFMTNELHQDGKTNLQQ